MALCFPQRPVSRIPADVNLMQPSTMESEVARASAPAPASSDLLPKYRRYLPPRPITKSSLCQEKVFKKLSGDERRILKCGRANMKQSKESYLLCTIAGFSGRDVVLAEPVGTCGFYENDARFLIIDGRSTLKNSEGLSLIDLPVACDIRVYEVERMKDVKSLYGGSVNPANEPAWRVNSFALEKPPPTEENIVFVENVYPIQHAVTVSGSWFPGFHTVHMGSREMPPVHSFLKGPIHQSKYVVEGSAVEKGLFYLKMNITPAMRKLCSHCFGENRLYPYMSQLRLLTEEELEQKRTECEEEHKMTLKRFTRQQIKVVGDSVIRVDCPFTPHRKDFQTKRSDRKPKDATVPNPSPAPGMVHNPKRNKCRQRSRTRSTDLTSTAAVSEKEVVAAAVNNPSSPPKVVKPDPIRCDLCPSDIQPMDEVYFKVSCIEDCHLSVHKKCLQESLARQGLHKKREYKDGICVRQACSAHLQGIHEFSVTNEESLYLKCAEKSRLEQKTEKIVKNHRKKDNSTRTKEKSVEPLPVSVFHEEHEEETVPVEVPAPPPSTLPVRAAWRPVLPPPKPNRSVPLPVDIENVVPLVKEKTALETKYAIFEQPKKKTKKSNKKKVVLDINVGFWERPMQEIQTGSQYVPEVSVEREIGQGRSQWTQYQYGDRLQWTQPAVNKYYEECKICLEAMGNRNDVMDCPKCGDSYHSQCVRTWLSTSATCPQCRRNWPDPVAFPALDQTGSVGDAGTSSGTSPGTSPGFSTHESSGFYRYFVPCPSIPPPNLKHLPAYS